MVQPELFDIYFRLKVLRDELNIILDELDKFDFEKYKEIIEKRQTENMKRLYQEAYQEAIKSLESENLKDQILKELEQRKVIPILELETKYKNQKDKLDQAIKELKDEKKIKIVDNYIGLEIQNKQTLNNREVQELKKKLEELEKKKASLEDRIQFMKKFGQDKINPEIVKEKEEELNKILEEIAKIKQQINM